MASTLTFPCQSSDQAILFFYLCRLFTKAWLIMRYLERGHGKSHISPKVAFYCCSDKSTSSLKASGPYLAGTAFASGNTKCKDMTVITSVQDGECLRIETG